jgi:hypothetical protein
LVVVCTIPTLILVGKLVNGSFGEIQLADWMEVGAAELVDQQLQGWLFVGWCCSSLLIT